MVYSSDQIMQWILIMVDPCYGGISLKASLPVSNKVIPHVILTDSALASYLVPRLHSSALGSEPFRTVPCWRCCAAPPCTMPRWFDLGAIKHFCGKCTKAYLRGTHWVCFTPDSWAAVLWQKEATLENDISRKWAKCVCHVHWYIDINAISLYLDLNIFQLDECLCSKLGMEVEYAKSNLKTSLS